MTNSQPDADVIDYASIRKAARYIARRLPRGYCLDANDLAQEAALAALRGRRSTSGPMLDLLRRQGWMTNHRAAANTHSSQRHTGNCLVTRRNASGYIAESSTDCEFECAPPSHKIDPLSAAGGGTPLPRWHDRR
jgi:hypothetical protein